MREIALAALLLFPACQTTSPQVARDPLQLKVGEKKLSFDTLHTLVPEKVINYEDPYGNGRQSAFGFPAHLVLEFFMGEFWKEKAYVVFSTRTGEDVAIPVSEILEHRPLLAYRYADSSRTFKIFKNSLEADLAPYYLIWDNVSGGFRKKINSSYWPFQIVAIRSAHENKTKRGAP